jgi:hypothetical protein
MFSAMLEVSALELFICKDKTQSLTLEFSSDSKSTEGCAIAQAVSCWLPTVAAWVQNRV